jgi:predicted regulator of Ras-like GTPase activity (Roadblock/LC7/MglB family)
MFGALKRIFGKSVAEVPASPVPSLPENKPRFGSTPPARPGVATVAPPPVPAARPPTPRPTPSVDADTISISYTAILQQIPQELWGRLAPAGVTGLEFPVARQQVLGQLAQGAVKVTFGDIRQQVPKGVFTDSGAHDHELVTLPLADILAQLHPDAYARRSGQSVVEVPAEVSDMFGPKGERLSPVRVADKREEAAKAAASGARSVRSTPPVSPSAPIQPTFAPTSAAPKLASAPPASAAVAPVPAQPAPVPAAAAIPGPVTPPAPEESPEAKTIPFPGVPVNAQSTPAKPKTPAPPVAKPVAPIAKPGVPAAKSAALPKSAPTPAAKPSAENGTLLVALADLADEWPDGVRQEIAQLKCPNPQVALPLAELGQALKRGRVQYTWKQLRTWITPPQFFDTPSPNGDTALDLPLKVITPLYIDKTHGTSFFKKQSYADKIPDVFAKAETPPLVKSAPSIPPTPPVVPVAAPVTTPTTAPTSAPKPPAPRPPAENALVIEFAKIFADWPEPVRHEITTLELDNAKLEIPFLVLERDLKQGRLAYPWKEILSWVNPPAPDVHTSPNAETDLELPLQLLAPLFFQQRSQANKKKAVVPTNIPDLFSSSGQIEAPPVSTPAPMAPVAPVAAVVTPQRAPSIAAVTPVPGPTLASTPTPTLARTIRPSAPVPTPSKVPQTLGELFGQPQKQNWTPNELVQKTAALPGLIGALIALQDGFLVAATMPPAWKTETISAFLPQIFGRLNQYCHEIGIGESRTVTFSVEEGALQIFKAGIIYLAILAQPGATIPEAAVALITAELSRHTK